MPVPGKYRTESQRTLFPLKSLSCYALLSAQDSPIIRDCQGNLPLRFVATLRFVSQAQL